MTYQLVIGDRSYSSWSLRGWLLLSRFELDAEVTQLRMYTPDFAAGLESFAPARQVPALRTPEGWVVHDTLAIAETLAERHGERDFWPQDPARRAQARSLVAEMHSGFGALRRACPMNLRRAYAGFAPDEAVLADLRRIEMLWARAGGEIWLFGSYGIVDAFFAPVAARIAGYGLPVGPEAQRYVARHLADPAFRRWRAMGFAEGAAQERYDVALPEAAWPGPEPSPAAPVEAGRAINALCPFSQRPVVPEALARVGDTVLGFCNRFCRDKVVADPEAWPEAMRLLGAD